MIKFKMNILEALKAAGYSSYALRQMRAFGQSTIALLRENKIPKAEALGTICELLQCQPGDILEYVPDDKGASR